MPTFVLEENPGFEKPITLCADDEHHLRKVMRAKTGETFFVTDNQGTKGTVKVTNHNPFAFELIKKENGPEPSATTLHLPLIDQTRLEWAIEKLAELNIACVQLVITEFTQRHELNDNKLQRLHKAALTAQKQCGRVYPLEIKNPKTLHEILEKNLENVLVADFSGESQLTQTQEHKNIFIGPEGGFSEQELQLFQSKKAQFFKLGDLILRAETAAIISVTKP